MCRCAPALIALRSEINKKWPARDKASDGCCGDAAHAARKSDHNPDASGYAHALDIDEDIVQGGGRPLWDTLRPILLRDSRTKYVIYEGRIMYPDGTNKPYTGVNAHDHHLHLSIKSTATHDTRPWLAYPTPRPAPAPTEEVDNMPMTCTVPWMPRRADGRVPFLEVIPVQGANEALVVSYNDATFTPPWNDRNDGDDVIFGFWARRLMNLTGPPVGIHPTPDGTIVVTCRGGGTYDVAKAS